MPTYKMRAPNGRVYQIQGPAGATDEQVRAAILRQFPEAGKPAPKPKEPMSRTEAFVRGVERGMRPVGDVMQALDPVSNIVNYFFPSVEKKQTARQARLAKEAEQAAADRPGFFTGGKITGEIAATAPLIATGGGAVAATGGRLARVGGQMAARGTTGARAVQKGGRALEATGKAIQTGGVGVRAPSRTAVAAKAPIAATRTGRMGLRVGGGATAGTAAAILSDQELTDAALAGSVIPVIGTIGRRGAGFVYDALRGRLGEVRAAEIMRNLIASNPSEIAAALRSAPDDARSNTAEYLASQGLLTPELAAATRMASASAEGAPLEQVARARAAGQEEMRTALRGGETGTEAMQGIGGARQELAEVTDPMREQALLAAGQGLPPLDIDPVIGNLRQKAAEAEFVNPPRFRVLTEFANNLERRAASQGGVIDAPGLYELRKSMADTIADLLGPMDAGALQRRTAALVGETKPLIDDAIEAAGGSGWRQYLRTFEAGMQNIERQQFARALEKLPEARFERVMAGQDPDFVSKFFGPGRYDINVELFGSQLPVAQQLAGEIRATRAVAATGQEALAPSQKLGFRSGAQARVNEAFQPGMKNIFVRGLSRVLGGVPGVYGGGVAADQMAREMSQQISQNAMRELAPGLVSPQRAADMLGIRSSSNKIAQIVNSLSPAQRAVLGQALVQGVPAALAPVPAAPARPDFDEFGNYIGPR